MNNLPRAVPMVTTPSLGLLAYLVVSGLRTTVLKGLQRQGMGHLIGGINPISFCNVFLVSQLMIALPLIAGEPGRIRAQIRTLTPGSRIQLGLDSFLGCFLAPMSFFLALDQLSVISQTLLFSLTLPVSALLALFWLGERLPTRFWMSLGLITAGLILQRLVMGGALPEAHPSHQLIGVLWALVSIAATATRNCLRRSMARLKLCNGLATGIPNLAGALAFAIIALVRYGPGHFFYLKLWWVVGVIGLYGITLCLGNEILRQFCQRHFTVSQVGLASASSLVVTVLSAAAVLHEPLAGPTLIGCGLILAGVSLRFILPLQPGSTTAGTGPAGG